MSSCEDRGLHSAFYRAAAAMSIRQCKAHFKLVLLLLVSLLLLSLPQHTPGEMSDAKSCEKTWCVAKPSATDADLAAVLRFACSEADCAAIEPGGPCYLPRRSVSAASVAMNAYYQAKGRNPWNCYFNGTALLALTDPSYGGCTYA